MATETEIERMVVRLVGDGASFEKMLSQANASAQRTANNVSRAGRQVEDLQKKLERGGIALASAGRRISLFLSTTFGALGYFGIKAGADFDSGFAGVRKTVNATEQELENLRREFKELAREIPVAIEEMLKIGEIAGQLGIQTHNIKEFTRVIAMLGVSTNLTGEEAATTLARFANITQLPQSQFSNLASAIVALGNGSQVTNEQLKDLGKGSATTERDIAAMAIRLAGAGTTIGLTVPQILGLSTALSSVGLEAELGGTAMSRLFLEMKSSVALGLENLETFAQTAGMTVEQFTQEFRVNAIGAVTAFIKGLKNLDSESRVVAIKSMGVEGIRLTDVLLRASNASDLMTRSLASAEESFVANTALAKEASERFKTFWSQVTLLKNELKLLGEDAFKVVEEHLRSGIQYVKEAAVWFRDLDKASKLAGIGGVGLAAVLGPLLILMGNLIWSTSQVVKVFQDLSRASFGLTSIQAATTWFFNLHNAVAGMRWFPVWQGAAKAETGLSLFRRSVHQTVDEVIDADFTPWYKNNTAASAEATQKMLADFDRIKIGVIQLDETIKARGFRIGTSAFTAGAGPQQQQDTSQKLLGGPDAQKLLEFNGVATQTLRIAGVTQKRIEGLSYGFTILTAAITDTKMTLTGLTSSLTVMADAVVPPTKGFILLSRASTNFIIVTDQVKQKLLTFQPIVTSTDMILSNLTTRFQLLNAAEISSVVSTDRASSAVKLLGYNAAATTTMIDGMTRALIVNSAASKGASVDWVWGAQQAAGATKLLGDSSNVIDTTFRRYHPVLEETSQTLGQKLYSALGKAGSGFMSLVSRLPSFSSLMKAAGAAVKFFYLEIGILVGVGIYHLVTFFTGAKEAVAEFEAAIKKSTEATDELIASIAHTQNKRMIQAFQIEDPGERRKFLEKDLENAKKNAAAIKEQIKGLEQTIANTDTTWNTVKLWGSLGFAGTGKKFIEDLRVELTNMEKQAAAATQQVRTLETTVTGLGPAQKDVGQEKFNPVDEAKKQAADDAKKSIEGITASLQEQLATWGMTANEVEIWRAKSLGAGDDVIASMQQVADEIKMWDNLKAGFDFFQKLQDEAETFGMTANEAELYRLKKNGLSELDIAAAEALIKKNAAMEKEKQLMEEAASLIEKYATPQQKFNKEKAKYDELLKKNLITQEIYNAAIEDAKKILDGTKDKEVKLKFSVKGVEAVEAGSAEALARINAFQAFRGGIQNTKAPISPKKLAQTYGKAVPKGAAAKALQGAGAGALNVFDVGRSVRAAKLAFDSEAYQTKVNETSGEVTPSSAAVASSSGAGSAVRGGNTEKYLRTLVELAKDEKKSGTVKVKLPGVKR